MLFGKDAFSAYSDLLIEKVLTENENFAGGDAGFTIAELKHMPGLGAKCLVNMAMLLDIPEDTIALKFVLTADLEVQYCVPPAFRKGKNDAGENTLFFNAGDFKLSVGEVFKKVRDFNKENSYGEVKIKVLTIPGQTPKDYAGFSFNLTKPISDPEKEVEIEEIYDFPVAFNRKIEDAEAQLVNIFNSTRSGVTPPEMLKAIANSDFTGGLYSGGFPQPLKNLPVGIYEVSEIDRLDEMRKDKEGQPFKEVGWLFTAKNIHTGQVWNVKANDSSFFGQKISGSGFTQYIKQTDPNFFAVIREALAKEAEGKTDAQVMNIVTDTPQILKQAAIGRNGFVTMLLAPPVKSGKGMSPKGEVMTNPKVALIVFNKQLPELLAKEQQLKQAVEQQKLALLPPAAATLTIEPTKTAEPAAVA